MRQLTFGDRAIAWISAFARHQEVEALRIAIEKDGCAEAVYTCYPDAVTDGDVVYPFADCLVAVDPTTSHFLGRALIDLDADGALEALRPVAISGECGKTSGSCSCGDSGGG